MTTLNRIAAVLMLVASAEAQVKDDVLLYGQDAQLGGETVLRVSRKLELQSATPAIAGTSLGETAAIATDSVGNHWIAAAPLGPTTLMRIDNVGGSLPSTLLGENPVQVAAAADGRTYALTRIPLLDPGLMYCANPDGSIAWSNFAGPSNYTLIYPRRLCVTTTGELWMGDVTPLHGGFWAKGLLLRIDPNSGAVMQTLVLPDLSGSGGDEGVPRLVGDIDGTLWALHVGSPDGQARLVNTNGEAFLQSMIIEGGTNGATWDTRVDGSGRLTVVSLNTEANGSLLYRYDPATPSTIDATFTLGGIIRGFALGATGEDVYAVVAPLSAPLTRRAERLNLVTGVRSSVSLEAAWLDLTIADGDPTGFIYANVVDRQGDNDGDGSPNGAETAAGSNPFDSTSRPNGPKVYISFAQSNGALILKYVDPDGLLNATGGLNLGSLSVVSSQHGQIFQFLLSFLTFAQVSPDGTEVTAFFGALPIAPNLKWQFEATVADKTGATGWDWQVTRPGDL